MFDNKNIPPIGVIEPGGVTGPTVIGCGGDIFCGGATGKTLAGGLVVGMPLGTGTGPPCTGIGPCIGGIIGAIY